MKNDNKYAQIFRFTPVWTKLISFISAGILLRIFIFLDRLAENVQSKSMLITALISLVVSIFGALGIQLSHLSRM